MTVSVARMVGPPTSSTAPGHHFHEWRSLSGSSAGGDDVLDDHDRVVDQDADREDQREQRHAVQRVSRQVQGEQRRGQGEHGPPGRRSPPRAGRARQNEPAPHGSGGEEQLLDQLDRLVVGGRAVVARLRDSHLAAGSRCCAAVERADHGVGDVDGVLARLLGDD